MLLFAIGFGGGLLPLGAAPARAAEPTAAAQLKAAFVFNFSKYTEWPDTAFANADAPLEFCLFSTSSEVGSAIAALDGNLSHNRRIRVSKVAQVGDLSRCHLVFVEQGSRLQATQLPTGFGAAPVLTIGEQAAFAEEGGVIGLVPKGGRLAFEVNLSASRRAGLRLSSQLLALARIIDPGQGGPNHD